MNPEENAYPYPSVQFGARRVPDPKDPDYSVVLSIAPVHEQITFASRDRLTQVVVPWEDLPRHQDRMTVREWDGIVNMLKRHVGQHGSTTSTFSVSETSRGSLRNSAQEVLNALAQLGASSDDALAIILSEITASDDPFKTGGDWIARFTNAVNAIIKEAEANDG